MLTRLYPGPGILSCHMAQEASFYACLEKAQQQNFNRYVRQGWQANYANILVRLIISLAEVERHEASLCVFSRLWPLLIFVLA